MEKHHGITALKSTVALGNQNPKPIDVTNRNQTAIKPAEVIERIKNNPILANIVLINLRSEPTPHGMLLAGYQDRLGEEFMSSYGFFRSVMSMQSYPDIPLDSETVDQALEDPAPAAILSQIGKTATFGEQKENMDEIRRQVYRSNELLALTRQLIIAMSTQPMEEYDIMEQAS